jgi:hypothetical protein
LRQLCWLFYLSCFASPCCKWLFPVFYILNVSVNFRGNFRRKNCENQSEASIEMRNKVGFAFSAINSLLIGFRNFFRRKFSRKSLNCRILIKILIGPRSFAK